MAMKISPVGARLLLISWVTGSFLGSGAARAQSLESMVQFALDTNPKVQAARSTARATNYEIDQAQAAWSPRVGVVADPGKTFRAAGAGVTQAGDLALRGSKLLYDGGKADAEIDRQKARLEAADQRVLATAEQLANQIADLYLEAVKQSRLAKAAADNVAAHQDLVKRVQDIVAVDRGRGSDLIQGQARLEQAKLSLQQRESALQEARAQVASIVNRPLANLAPVRDASAAAPKSEADALSLLDSHPAVLAANADAAAAAQVAKAADSWNKPRIDLQSTWQRDPSYLYGHYGKAFDVRFVSNWTGYDGGAGKAAAAAAREQVQTALNTTDSVKRDLSNDVTRNWQAIATRSARVGTWGQLVRQLGEVKDGYWEQFKIGRRSILDLLNVQSEIFQAYSSAESDQAEIDQSQYRLLGATAQLNTFLGLTINPPGK